MIIRMLEGYDFWSNLYSMVAIKSVKFRENRGILFSLRMPEENERFPKNQEKYWTFQVIFVIVAKFLPASISSFLCWGTKHQEGIAQFVRCCLFLPVNKYMY